MGAEPTITVTGKVSTSIGGVIVSAVGSTEEVVPIDFGTKVTFESDSIYDPIESAITDLHEQYPNIPIEELEAQYLAALSEHEEVYAAGTSRPPEAGVVQLADPAFSTNAALHESLEAANKYQTYITRHDPGSPEDPPTSGNTGGSGSGSDGNTNNHDDHDHTPIGSGSSGPAGGPVPAADDPVTGHVGPAGGPIPPSPPHTPPYLDPDVSGPQPVLLDLDGDGIEVAFGEKIYFDTDGDGFLEKTAWVAADDGFLVLDLNADGTRGAGDGVIARPARSRLRPVHLRGADLGVACYTTHTK